MSFHTFKGICYYKAMTWIENSGTTYQWTKHEIFDNMFHKKVECYVDILVVKKEKKKFEDQLQDLYDILKRIWQYELKMNLLKCAFGITSREFLDLFV